MPAALPKAVTFDVYGTLVRFHEAVEGTLARVIETGALPTDVMELKAAWRATQHALQQAGEWLPYKRILARGLEQALAERGWAWRPEYGEWLVEAVATAGPHPEVPLALRAVKAHTRIVYISNTDNDMIPRNIERITVAPDLLVTAEDAGCYKPAEPIFRLAWERAGVAPEEIVHVAAGFEHDIEPMHALGVRRVWINRRGEPGNPAFGPYEELPDLSSLPRLLGF